MKSLSSTIALWLFLTGLCSGEQNWIPTKVLNSWRRGYGRGSSTSSKNLKSSFALVAVDVAVTGAPLRRALSVGIYGDFGQRFLEDSSVLTFVPLTPKDGCKPTGNSWRHVRDKVAVLWKGNCTYARKALNAQAYGAAAVVIIDKGDVLDGMRSGPNGHLVHIPVLKVKRRWGERYLRASIQGKIMKYDPPLYDIAKILVASVAILTIIGGAYLSASGVFQETDNNYSQLNNIGPQNHPTATLVGGPMVLNEKYAWGFIMVSAILLVVLFKFIHAVEYVLKLVFCLAGAMGVYSLSSELLESIHPSLAVRCCCDGWSFAMIMSAIAASIIASLGAVLRTEWYSWFLHDVMGVAFLLMLQRIVHPSIKGSTILLTLALLYNVFLLVFSPDLYQESVLSQTTEAGLGKYATPMLIRIPYLAGEFRRIHYAVIGLGDIGIPGLYLSNLLQIDIRTNLWVPKWGWRGKAGGGGTKATEPPQKIGYFALGAAGYVAGIILTQAMELLTGRPQPALVYLAPCVLAPVFTLALMRGRIEVLWDYDDSQIER
eukprot:jgi/Bigna1/144684/aug1.90_g19392